MKRFIITESEKNNIREMYGLINEQEDIISQYVTDSRLKKFSKKLKMFWVKNLLKKILKMK